MARKTMLPAMALVAIAALGEAGEPGPDVTRSWDPVVEYTQTSESGGAVKVSLWMQTDAESLWSVLLSCERSYAFVEGLRACESLDGGLRHERIRQRVKKSALLPSLDYVIEFDRRPYDFIEFRRVEGDLDVLEGEWRFEPAPDGALRVTHELRVRPSFPVPRWLVRRSLARDVPDLLLCLRALTDGSPDAAHGLRDRSACPSGKRAEGR